MAESVEKKRKGRKVASKRQPRAQITSKNILKAALQEFAQLGLAGARVDKIAQRAKVNKQILYYHFGNKEDLFRATLAAEYDRPFPTDMLSLPTSVISPTDKMRILISNLFNHFRDIEDGVSLIGHEDRYHGKHLTPALKKTIRKSLAPILDSISMVLKQGQDEGVFVHELSADHLYLTLVAMSMFYFTHAYTLSAILDTNLLAKDAIEAWQKTVENVVLSTIQGH